MTGPEVTAAAASLRRMVVARAAGRPYLVSPDLFGSVPAAVQQLAVDRELACAVEGLVRHGWTPADLFEVARRRLEPVVVDHLLTVVATLTSRSPITTVDPRWAAQLASLGIVRHRSAAQWAWRSGIGWPDACAYLVGLLVQLRMLPRLEHVLAPPGAYHPGRRGRFETRRMWLDAPYVNQQALLVQQVAEHHGCFAVLTGDLGMISLVGDSAALNAVEDISAALLAEARREMAAAAARATEYGSARTDSFRQAFLVAFAHRATERLRDHGEPRRVEGARRAAMQTFPRVGTRPLSARHPDGLRAGLAAAERADVG